MDRSSSNFVYGLILTRYTLELLPANLLKFITELWPLIDVRFSFPPFNIFRRHGQNFTKFCTGIDTDKLYFGIVTRLFSQNCNRVKVLD